jgi:putative transposase
MNSFFSSGWGNSAFHSRGNSGYHFQWARRGKPTDNGTIERFNGSLRDECLNVNWFLSTEDACEKIEEWRQDYNFYRPHSSLNNQTPYDFAATQRSEKILLFAGPGFG